MTRKDTIEIAKDDVLVVWAILENLAVSFDQIGAAFSGVKDASHNPEQQRAVQEALLSYLTPALVQSINEARSRLGQYISDEDAETLTEHIVYWDYTALGRLNRPSAVDRFLDASWQSRFSHVRWPTIFNHTRVLLRQQMRSILIFTIH